MSNTPIISEKAKLLSEDTVNQILMLTYTSFKPRYKWIPQINTKQSDKKRIKFRVNPTKLIAVCKQKQANPPQLKRVTFHETFVGDLPYFGIQFTIPKPSSTGQQQLRYTELYEVYPTVGSQDHIGQIKNLCHGVLMCIYDQFSTRFYYTLGTYFLIGNNHPICITDLQEYKNPMDTEPHLEFTIYGFETDDWFLSWGQRIPNPDTIVLQIFAAIVN
jgi:hypothetical protein